ncbi:hypothetical protein PGT21_000157 [Puccinia graminis f. sp. tritici]|uniref:RING-type E3 ubiquitin transferase n=1 Tax=Puccinia graminis f. sp. tritici TaxID=56615 RepID=A0A5B0Q0M6_PUCGR|nr:hypothetical protein PGT21_000157 [Puccinia graminis f. sp. tritici]
MPFYKAHDPIDSDIFSHRILVTSTYLLFLANPSDAPLLAAPSKSPHFGDPDDSQKRLIGAWTDLAENTILHPSNHIPSPIVQLRTHVSDSLPEDHPRPTRSSFKRLNLTGHIRINGLVYSLLSIYNSIESLSVIHESSNSEEEDTESNGYQPDIHEMIRKHDPVFLSNLSPDQPSVGSLKHSLVTILVKQKILTTLVNSSTFLRYSRGMASDDNLFTNWRLKSTRPFSQSFLDPQRVINPENDLCEITIQLINFKATVEPRLKLNKPDDEDVPDWIDHVDLGHKLLVTSSYLLLSDEVCDTFYPALHTPGFLNALENPNKDQQHNEILLLQAWLKLATNCAAKSSELLLRFKNFALHSSVISFEDRIHSFQRLETEWLSKLLSDPSIAQFLVLILTQNNENERATASLSYHTPHFFLLKLLYVYTVLETLIPRSESQQAGIIYENASKILDEHLKRLQAESSDRIHQVLEMIRQTRFLLDSCQPAKSLSGSTNPPNNDMELRSELLITRMKRGIIGILARQKVLSLIVTDRRFTKYARAMLFEPNLFSQVTTLPILEQLEEDDQNMLDYERIDKGKQKAPDQTLLDDQAAGPSEEAAIDEEDSLIKSEHLAESSVLDQSLDPSSHIDTFDWSEDAGKCSSQASSTHADGKDIISGNFIESSLADDANLLSTQSVSPAEDLLPTENGSTSSAPKIVAERAVAGRLPGFGPQRLQREAALGPGLADGFVFDEAGGANAADDELMAEDIDGILELIGMKGSLLMLAQNVGLMTMLLSLSLLAFVHLPHMIGKIAVLIQQLWSFAGSPEKSFAGLSQWLDRWPITELVRLSKTLVDQGRPLFSSFPSLNTVWQKILDRVGDRLNGIAYGSKPIDRALAVLLGYFELALMSLFYLSSGLDQQRARFVSETIVNGMQQQLLIGKVGIFIFVELVIFPFLCGLLLNFTTIPIFANATFSNRLELYSSAPYSATLITWLVGTCFMFSFAILVSTCRESLRPGVCWWIRDPSDDRFNPIREILERSAWSQIKKISASAIMYGTVVVFGLGSIVFNLVFFTGTLPLRIHADRPISSSALDLVIYQTFLPFFLECFQPRTRLKECLQAVSRYVARQLRLTCYLYGERRIAEETTLEVVVFGSDGLIRPVERRARFSPMRFFKSHDCRSSSSSGKKEDRSQSKRVSKGTLSRRRKWAGGSFARVPASDAVKVVPGRKMHIPVHVDGTPIDPADMTIIEQQQAEAREEGGAAGAEQYTIVYLPPQFQIRMTAYVIFMWAAAVHLGWLAIVSSTPRSLPPRPVLHARPPRAHDVYAYALGILCCAILLSLTIKVWAGYSRLSQSSVGGETGWGEVKANEWELEGSEAGSEDDESEEEEEEEEEGAGAAPDRAGNADRAGRVRPVRSIWRRLGSQLYNAGHILVLILVGGVGLPILAAIVVELYVLGLVKPKQPGLPAIFLLEAWTYGCIYLSIAARLLRLLAPTHSLSVALDQIVVRWRAGEVDRVVQEINLNLLIPIGSRLLLSILLPFLLVQPIVLLLLRERDSIGKTMIGHQIGKILDWLGLSTSSSSTTIHSSSSAHHLNQSGVNPSEILSYLLLRLIYPLILSWFSQLFIAKNLFLLFSNWIEKVRDDRFLENRRLKKFPIMFLIGAVYVNPRLDSMLDKAHFVGFKVQ